MLYEFASFFMPNEQITVDIYPSMKKEYTFYSIKKQNILTR